MKQGPIYVTPSKLASMALHMQPEDIAERFRIPLETVISELKRLGRAGRWIARNHDGRTVKSTTERGAYLQTQLQGFTDWCFIEAQAEV